MDWFEYGQILENTTEVCIQPSNAKKSFFSQVDLIKVRVLRKRMNAKKMRYLLCLLTEGNIEEHDKWCKPRNQTIFVVSTDAFNF